jgi:hypothetical protein
MELATAGDIINDAAVELGILPEDVADPFASTNQNVILLCRLLKRVGRSLVRARDWTHLLRTHGFTTTASENSYAVPSAFSRMVDQTHWNLTTVSPLGAVGSQELHEMYARASSGGHVRIRLERRYTILWPVPTSEEVINYEYVTSSWVAPVTVLAPTVPAPATISAPTVGTDWCWFDENLLVRGLKLAYLRAKGFDTSHAQDEFNQAFDAAAGSDGAAGPISVLGGTSSRLAMGSPPGDTGEWGI